MKKPVCLLVLLLCFGGISSALAQDTIPSAVREVMERMGFVASFEDYGDRIKRSLPEEAPAHIPRDIVEPLAEIVGEELNGQRLLALLERALIDGISADDLDAINAFVASPLGSRVTALEIAATSERARRELAEQRTELVAELESDPARRAVFQRMDEALHGSEIAAAASLNMTYAMLAGMLIDADDEILSELRGELEVARADILRYSRETLMASFAQIYRDVATEELEDYAAFLESTAAGQLYGLLHSVVFEFYRNAGENIGERMAELMRQRKS